MNAQLSERLRALAAPDAVVTLQGIRRGIEKESLRVTPKGQLAVTPHPAGLGSALKHCCITTDFSEALLEFITPVCESIDDAMSWLSAIHRFSVQVLDAQDEMLWAASMPCALEGETAIPVAQYGTSHAARMKTLYRTGLAHRYGKVMQTIAGIHYNFSLPDNFWLWLQEQEKNSGPLQQFKTQRYFDLIRNFRRHFWLLLYLFGASPAICPTFVAGRSHQLQDWHGHSLYLPFATSLRMGGLGYQSSAQDALPVCYNQLATYLRTLKLALTTPHPQYEKIGLRDATGEYRQLSTSLLQIENEFYSTIRPKRVTFANETPLTALFQRGVEYIEVRCLDLNPFLPLGMNAEIAHVVEVFLLHCLLHDSPLTDEQECHRIALNQRRVVEAGRDPALTLEGLTGARTLRNWGQDILAEMGVTADVLDKAQGGSRYRTAVDAQMLLLQDSEATPSARWLSRMATEDRSFFHLARRLSREHHQALLSLPADPSRESVLAADVPASMTRQREQEAGDQGTFESYLASYFSQYAAINPVSDLPC